MTDIKLNDNTSINAVFPPKPKRPSYKKLYKNEIQQHNATKDYYCQILKDLRNETKEAVYPTLWQRLWGA